MTTNPDETAGVDASVVARLIYDGLLFGTTYKAKGSTWGGRIIARDWAGADEAAKARPFGEEVDGQIEAIIIEAIIDAGRA